LANDQSLEGKIEREVNKHMVVQKETMIALQKELTEESIELVLRMQKVNEERLNEKTE
jgi:hypothetical protein